MYLSGQQVYSSVKIESETKRISTSELGGDGVKNIAKPHHIYTRMDTPEQNVHL